MFKHIFIKIQPHATHLSPAQNETWYTAKELTDLEELGNTTYDWLITTWKEQNKTKLTEEPVLTLSALKMKTDKLDRELLYLAKKPKPRPKVTPKPKPAKAKATPTSDTQSTLDDKPTVSASASVWKVCWGEEVFFLLFIT